MLPCTRVPAASRLRLTPLPMLLEMMLRAPGSVPPIVVDGASDRTPSPELPRIMPREP